MPAASRRVIFALLSSCCAVGVALPAFAEEVPAGVMKQDAASTGATDVAGGGTFEAVQKPDPAKEKDATEAQILGGGMQATGNSRSLALTTSGKFRVRRRANQFAALAAANYARAASDAATPTETTVENYQGKVRYDRFVASEFAVFLSVAARRDRFQQLNLRLNVDPGVAYYFLDEAKQQLWGELGYDFQFDIRRQAALDAAALATPPAALDRTKVTHSGRLFAGYSNQLNDAVSVTTGLEYLQSVTEAKGFRINWDAGLNSKIAGNFSLATTFSLRYDNNPIISVKNNTDTMTAVSLVYQLL
jgi:putative salt-induced outer membrane protein